MVTFHPTKHIKAHRMSINAEFSERFKLFLKGNGFKMACLACGKSEIEPAGITTMLEHTTSNATTEGRSRQCAQLVCADCGHIMLFDASKAGLLDSSETKGIPTM